ncbi:MAG TPA: alkaline phosphatase, partial [Leeuwenhoekiella sp.]|nr:alkaline phosphatase [Leeuwenhoekiella sp.]
MNLSPLKSLALGLIALTGTVSFGQKTSQKPKLVVGIVVDQMRYDYLTRFENQYGEDGFKRLQNEGFD